MPFSKIDEIPPILEQVIIEIKNKDGVVTRKEFKNILYKLRITSDDITYYRRYLEELDYIIVDKKTVKLKNHRPHKKGIAVSCPTCGYQWNYKGHDRRAKCPHCEYNKKIVWIKITLPNIVATLPT